MERDATACGIYSPFTTSIQGWEHSLRHPEIVGHLMIAKACKYRRERTEEEAAYPEKEIDGYVSVTASRG